MNVLLVHGFFDTGAIFRHLGRELESRGHRCLIPSLKPADGRRGIRDLACKLKSYVDEEIGPEEPLAIVGFSMGCIISRQYIQALEGFRRTRAFFAISGPHRGTWTAYLYPGQGTRDMRPGSALLQELKVSEDRLQGIPLFAYWTPLDITILPATSCVWEPATNLRALTILHRLMPYNRKVRADIVQRLDAI